MGHAVGGCFQQVERDQVPFKVGPEKHKWHQQIFDVNSVADHRLPEVKAEKGKVTQDEWDLYNDPKKVIERDLELIEHHVDRRVQLFFMQLLCVKDTPFHYEWIEANDEYGKGGNYTLKNPEDGKTSVFQTEAAHSSTFPCLVAYPREEWEKYQKGEGPKPKGFVYLKYGHNYLQQNGTMELARFVNRADCLVDGTHTDSRLRNEAIDVINAAAKGDYSLQKGMKKFAKLFVKYTDKAKEPLDDGDPRFLTLERYLNRLQDVQFGIKWDPGYFDQLLGIKIEDQPQDTILRDVVYRKRYKLLQRCEHIESQIARSILDAQNTILGTRKKSLKSVDYRLRYILLEEVDPVLKRRLERLFCTSLEQLQVGIERNEERLREFEARAKIKNFREKHEVEIGKLKDNIDELFQALHGEELNYRADLFKGLRWDFKKWYGREFVAAFKKSYPRDSMSCPMVSRMEQRVRSGVEAKQYKTPLEQRRKDIEVEKAKKIAHTFGIDPGLFLPGIVTSSY